MIDQDKLTSIFGNYLTQEGSSEKTKKNYIADLLDFLSWHKTTQQNSIQDISEQTIQNYIKNLQTEAKSISTINRRLSTLRIFFRACEQAQLIASSPINTVHNLENTTTQHGDHKHVMESWHTHLTQRGINRFGVQDHLNVVGEFLDWIKTNTRN